MRGPTVTHTNRGAKRGRLAVVVVAAIAAILGATLVPTAAYADGSGSISGHLRDEAYDDLAGATVSLFATQWPAPDQTTTTDASGEWSFTGVDNFSYYKVSFEKPGYATQWWNGQPSPNWGTEISVYDEAVTGIDDVLYFGATITGTVTADGDPLAGVSVYAFDDYQVCNYREDEVVSSYCEKTTTDALGHFTFDTLAGGSYRLLFHKEGYVDLYNGGGLSQWDAPTIDVNWGETNSGNGLTMVEQATISGTLTSLASGDPIEDAWLMISDTAGNYLDDTTTDEFGNYTFDGLFPGTYKVKFQANGYLPAFWNNKSRLGTATHITLLTGQDLENISAVLDPGASVSGTITMAGEPLAEADVSVHDSRGNLVTRATTDENGHYTASGLAAGSFTVGAAKYEATPCVVGAFLGGGAEPLEGTLFPVTAHGSVTGKNIALVQCGVISGTVEGAGTPNVPLQYVTVTAYDAGGQYLGSDGTEVDGSYSFDLRPGTYRLEVTNSDPYAGKWYGGGVLESSAQPITVAAAATATANFTLSLGGTISGNVKQAPSTNLYNAYVIAFSQTGEHFYGEYTDDQGNYTISGLPADTYKVQFSGGWNASLVPVWWSTNTPLESSAATFSVSSGATVTGKNGILPIGAAVTGRVTSAIDGEPLLWADVTALSSTGEQLAFDQTDEDGVYELDGLRAGSVTLEFVQYGAYAKQWWSNKSTLASATYFTVANGTTYANKNAALVGTASISGHVTDPLGGDVDSVFVGAFQGSSSEPVQLTVTDGDGYYTLPGLSAGSYLLGFSDYGTGAGFLPNEGVEFKTEFYNNQPTRAAANAVAVGAAAHVTGRDVQLAYVGALLTLTAPTPTITGSAVMGQTLTAVPGVWGPAPVALTYKWQRAGVDVPGKTASTYPVTAADVGQILTVSVTGAKSGYSSLTKTSAATFAVVGTLTAPVPTITGTGAVGQTLTAVAGAWGPAPVDLTYQWSRNGEPVEGETSSTYVLGGADAGNTVTVTVTGAKDDYATVSKTSVGKAVGNVLVTAVPTVTGIPTVGKPQTAVAGSWGPAPVSLAYQWKRDGTPIAGALSSVYTATAADSGKALSVTVTGSKAGYTSASQTSVAAPIGNAFTAAPVPVIVGTPTAGTVLTATVGTWAPAPVALAYQWLRDGSPIPGETGTAYTPSTADANSSISFRVTGTKAGFTPVTTTSAAKVVGLAFSDIGVPAISGQPTVGQTLTADPGSWSPAGTAFAYQWKRAGVAIAGATGATYTLVAADGAKQVSVTVTGSKASYLPVAVTSAPVVVGLALSGPVPTITGVPTVGQRVTAVAGTWAPAPVALSYQWYRDGGAIAGATASSYLLTGADAATDLTVLVRGARAGYTSIGRESAPASIGLAFDSALLPVINGTPTVGETLVANPGSWAPLPDSWGFQWKRAGVAIAGATDFMYTPVAADLGKAITVTVTGAKDGYTPVAKTSAAKTVGSALTLAPVPTVTGTPEVGFTLTAVPGAWAPAPVTLKYQWNRNAVPIAGATTATYKLVAADAGETVSVTVTGSKAGYTPVPQSSAVTYVKSLLVAPLPEIFGIPTVGEQLTVDAGLWAPLPVDLAVQWKRAGVAIPGATGEDYLVVAADLGKAITVTVTGTKDDFSAASRTSPPKTVGAQLTLVTAPSITGTPAVGSTLTAVPGTWGQAPVALKYQWYRSGELISGAIAATYKLVAADAGQTVAVLVTGSKSGYTPVQIVVSAVDIESLLTAPVPTVSGSTTVNSTLTAVTGEWGPAPVDLAYQWKRAGVAISGATGEDYLLVAADLAKAITVTVTGSKDGYTTASKTSVAKTIGNMLTATPAPTVTGTPAVGSVLTAAPGAWAPAPVAFSYKWLRNGTPIAAATAATYKLVAADAGQTITVTVTGSKTGFTPVPQTSAGTVVESLLTGPVPLVNGTPTVGEILSVDAGAWAPDPVDLAVQWKRAGVAIAGADGEDYQLVAADLGKAITVTVTGSKDGHTSLSKTSAAKTIGAFFTLAPIPTVTGTPAVGSILTAVPGAWAPAPVAFTYQWNRDGVPIAGAKAAAYKLVAADAGRVVTVNVTGSKAGYTAFTQLSFDVNVEALLTAPVPTIAGIPTVGETLTAVPGEWGPGSVDLSFQWKRAGVAIPGQTEWTYDLVAADLGKAITVTVTGAQSGFTSAVKTSAAKTVGGALTLATVPVVTGIPAVGSTLVVAPGTWGPAPVTLKFQWNRNGLAIAAATAATYKLVTADAGQAVTVTVTGSKTGYTPVAQTSEPTAVESLLVGPVPTIGGLAAVGESVWALPGVWGPGTVDLDYIWKRAGVTIPGATSNDYTLVAADAGKAITVTVVGSQSGYSTLGKASAATVPFASAPAPTVTGASTVGSVQTAVPGTWGAAPVVLKYQWKRDDVPIAGATAATYTLAATDVGTAITVTVTGTKAGYTTVVRTSDTVLALFGLIATPRPSIEGVPSEGGTLTANYGEWGPTLVTLTFQWYADGVPIDGATDPGYLVTVPNGTVITVSVTGSKDNYLTVVKTSSGILIQETS